MRVVYLASVWFHIMAAITWVGGMIAFVAAVMPYFRNRPAADRAAFLDWFGPRFRTVAWICIAVLVVTGTFNLWSRGVRIADFTRPEWRATQFGGVVIIKLSLVMLAIVISALHERVLPRTAARWMGRSLLVVGALIVAAAVMLVRAL